MNNELTRLLGIERPIIQGGMREISRAPLTAAVSNAGGLGTLAMIGDLQAWRDEINRTQDLTALPFSVNLPLHAPDLENRLQAILDEKVKVVTTAAGNPKRVLPELKAAGVKVLHVVASTEQAVKVEAAGADVIVAEGGESGGMVARDRVSTMVLVAGVVEKVRIPVVAAGGIANGRGLLAALALGAQGVQIGTRFIATPECDAPPAWKDALIRARDVDTEVVPRGKAQGRALKEEVLSGVMAGEVAGLIHNVESVQDIIERMMREAQQMLDKVRTSFGAAG